MTCVKWQRWLGYLTKVCNSQEINSEAILTWWQSEILGIKALKLRQRNSIPSTYLHYLTNKPMSNFIAFQILKESWYVSKNNSEIRKGREVKQNHELKN